ncbi:MAG TPA: hypothetical protein ENJ37_05835 [Deltaproteobacteria bacterium]|nr:hypothetical protein [Deltaproteobacteria bacterium]
MSRVVDVLGSSLLSMGLLVAGALYFAYLTALSFAALEPPAPFMVWGPFALWGALFTANTAVSLVRRRYRYRGNLVFHTAFLLVAAGAVASVLWRFEASAVVLEGEIFSGGPGEYDTVEAGSLAAAPHLSFRVESIRPAYWQGRLYFTGLEAEITYPAGSFSQRSLLRLNGGPSVGGARLRIIRYGFFPELLFTERGEAVVRRAVPMMVFPPGSEDVIKVKNYDLYIKVLSDPEFVGGRYVNRGMDVTEPLFLARLLWHGTTIHEGPFRAGESITFAGVTVTFTGLRQWVEVGVVRDPGEPVTFAGFVTAAIGLLMRLVPAVRRT